MKRQRAMQIELKPQIVQKETDCEACISGNGYHTCNQTVKIERSVEIKDNKFVMTTKENGKLLETEELTDREFNKIVETLGILEAKQ